MCSEIILQIWKEESCLVTLIIMHFVPRKKLLWISSLPWLQGWREQCLKAAHFRVAPQCCSGTEATTQGCPRSTNVWREEAAELWLLQHCPRAEKTQHKAEKGWKLVESQGFVWDHPCFLPHATTPCHWGIEVEPLGNLFLPSCLQRKYLSQPKCSSENQG